MTPTPIKLCRDTPPVQHVVTHSSWLRSKATQISGYIASQIESYLTGTIYRIIWYQRQIQILSKTDLIHTGKTTQLDMTGKQVTTSILVLPILIFNAELRSHSRSWKRGGIRLFPEFTIRSLSSSCVLFCP